jgi:hypothetical protein
MDATLRSVRNRRALIRPDWVTEPFLFTMARLIREHALGRAAGPLPFLAARLLDASPFRFDASLLNSLDLVQQQPPCEQPIHCLVARRLAFHAQPGWPVQEHDAGGTLVHLLSSSAAGADERFLNIALAHAQRTQSLVKFRQLVWRRRKRTHAASLDSFLRNIYEKGAYLDGERGRQQG